MSVEPNVYAADLRNGMIPCGECEFEEGEIMATREEHESANATKIDQILSLLAASNASLAHFQGRTEQEIKTVRDDLTKLHETVDKLTGLVNTTYAKVTNGQEDRIAKLEKHMDNIDQSHITRHEFNGAFASIRAQLRHLQWIFGLVGSSLVGLLVALILL
jgi:t-SNARE complex subunit (syntaxin)